MLAHLSCASRCNRTCTRILVDNWCPTSWRWCRITRHIFAELQKCKSKSAVGFRKISSIKRELRFHNLIVLIERILEFKMQQISFFHIKFLLDGNCVGFPKFVIDIFTPPFFNIFANELGGIWHFPFSAVNVINRLGSMSRPCDRMLKKSESRDWKRRIGRKQPKPPYSQ